MPCSRIFAVLFCILSFPAARAAAPLTEPGAGSGAVSAGVASESAARPLSGALDQEVTVTLQSGTCYVGATLLRVVDEDKEAGPTSVRVRLAEGRLRTLDLSDVSEITLAGESIFRGEATSPASEEEPAAKRRMPRAERREAAEAAAQKRRDVERRQWLARLAARSIKAWPEVSDREHEAAIAKHKATGARAQQLLPSLRLYETSRFLFYSNIPQQEVGPFIQRLDQMHNWMTATYNLPKDERVWLGKAPVYAFLEKEQFVAFERQFFQNDPQDGTYGLCHQNSDGEVVITCYRGQELMEFAAMVVHETSHGFIHRYKTMQSLPSWVNEGMADYIGALIVPQSQSVKRREEMLLARLKQEPVIRASFFGKGRIQFDEYGVASSMARFMIKANPDSYVGFIEGMKAGLTWEEALRESYGSKPEELLAAYGQWLGVGQLRVQ